MIRFVFADQIDRHPRLAAGMFADRARQFRDRLAWQVQVDARGHERDQYDRQNPLYLIWEGADGRHKGSLRFLPTTGRTMFNDHFHDLNGGAPIRDPFIWECTRFCLAPDAPRGVAAGLLAGAARMGVALGLTHALGVFDTPMLRVYRRLGWQPEVVGIDPSRRIGAGLWRFSEETALRMARAAGLDADLPLAWFDAAFPAPIQPFAA